MPSHTYRVIGVMSGTSLDGIDLVFCTFRKEKQWQYKLYKATTIPYSETWQKRLRNAVHNSVDNLHQLNQDYTLYLANVIQLFINQCEAIPELKKIDAVCSHGHTILHQPEKGITLQIGNLPILATLLNKTVVCDFRKQDVALGGQGAPLVPIGDQLLFAEFDYCLNLGGFANVSTQEKNRRIAYDICPVNIVLNPLAERLGAPYDDGGKFAKQGNTLPQLLEKLNGLLFYKQNYPKSLGLEWVLKNVFPLLDTNRYKTEDLLRTFTEHSAIQLATNFTQNSSVLVTGGGAYNSYLIERVKAHKTVNFIHPDDTLINYKEALIFGLLGVLKLRSETNCLASVTGAQYNHSSGVVYKQ